MRASALFMRTGLNRLLAFGFVPAAVLLLAGCTPFPGEMRTDRLPMYGQPGIQRPEFLRKADEELVKEAMARFGSREAASKAWASEADGHLKQSNPDAAMRRYNQAWLANPNNYEPYWGFGRIMLQRGDVDRAIDYFEKAKQLIDDRAQRAALLSDAGVAYSAKAESIPGARAQERAFYFDLANRHFRESTALDQRYPNSWRRWAMSLYREGNYREAWEKVKRARALKAPPFPAGFLRDLEQKLPEPK
ncbi:MAG: tetratricopeptide repeat protein [Candidatus Binatia bacterium]